MTIYAENPPKLTKSLLELSDYRKVVRYKVYMQKSTAFLNTKNKLEFKIKNTIQLTLVQKEKNRYSYVHTKTCTRMFTGALFIIDKNWKQSKCPSISKWLTGCLQSIHTMTSFQQKKKNKLLSHNTIWRSINCTLLGEQSQLTKGTYLKTQPYNISEKAKL